MSVEVFDDGARAEERRLAITAKYSLRLYDGLYHFLQYHGLIRPVRQMTGTEQIELINIIKEIEKEVNNV